MSNPLKPIRVTMPTGDYEVFPSQPDGMTCGYVIRLDHHERGTRRKEVWAATLGKVPGKAIATVIKLAGFDADMPYARRSE